jgi:hypothetical protein
VLREIKNLKFSVVLDNYEFDFPTFYDLKLETERAALGPTLEGPGEKEREEAIKEEEGRQYVGRRPRGDREETERRPRGDREETERRLRGDREETERRPRGEKDQDSDSDLGR